MLYPQNFDYESALLTFTSWAFLLVSLGIGEADDQE